MMKTTRKSRVAAGCLSAAILAGLFGACGGSSGQAACEPIADAYVNLYRSTMELSQDAPTGGSDGGALDSKVEDIKRQSEELQSRKDSSGCSDADLHSTVEKRDPEAASALLHG